MNEGSNDFGFCGSMNGDASVRTAVNAYALGAKYANPDAKVQVIWSDSWYDLDIEGNNAKTLINKGIKYMGMEASSPAIPQKCEEKGIKDWSGIKSALKDGLRDYVFAKTKRKQIK